MVQADLIDATERKQLWGERFNRPSADIFAVEDEIARQIVEKLRLKLSGDEKRQIANRYTEDPAAYDLYLKARHHWSKRTPESIRRSIEIGSQVRGPVPLGTRTRRAGAVERGNCKSH